jgi:DNA glycosylase AlkZ-like
MKSGDIAHQRLANQSISTKRFTNSGDLVAWFGAMQAQDFAAAKWAIGLRLTQATEASIEEAFNTGEILRTHVMRPTWHFVAPQDIRWLLALTAPRVHAFNGSYYRRSGLDKTIFKRSNAVLEKALQGGKQLTRSELDTVLQKAGIPTLNLGLSYTLMQAELDGVICSGPRRGKQFTYMLLEERVPKAKVLDREEALATLTKRYFCSHGPAQIQDFVWWSGLTTTDAKRGLELNKAHLTSEVIDGKTYWFSKSLEPSDDLQAVFLLPGFDEYFIAYRDRRAILDPKYAKHLNQGGGMVNGALIVKGKMVGGWKRTFKNNQVIISVELYEKIPPAHKRAINAAATSYGRFLNLPVRLTDRGRER